MKLAFVNFPIDLSDETRFVKVIFLEHLRSE